MPIRYGIHALSVIAASAVAAQLVCPATFAADAAATPDQSPAPVTATSTVTESPGAAYELGVRAKF